MTEDITQVKEKAVRSVKWAFLSNILPKSITPLTTVILARLLVPEDYGIIGMSAVFISFVNFLQDMGLSTALIQREKDFDEAANSTFWSNIAFGFFLGLTIVLLAPLISIFFHEPRLTTVLRVQSITILIASLSTIQNTLLRREFSFKRLMGLTLVPSLMPLVVAVPLAALGMGYWSLVLSMICGRTAQTYLLWRYSDWRPMWRYNIRVAKEMLVFGGWVALEGFLGWISVQGDKLVVGHFLNLKETGQYVFTYNIQQLAVGFFVAPLFGVIYPTYCRLSSHKEELTRTFLESIRMLSTVVIPMCLGLSLIATPLVPVVFGDRWIGIEPILRLLAFLGLSWISCLNPELYRAMGRPDIMVKINIPFMAYITMIYLFSVRYGVVGFSWGNVSLSIFILVHVLVAKRLLKLPGNYFWVVIKSQFFASLVMGAVVYAVVFFLAPYSSGNWQGWAKLAAIMASGVVSYSLALLLIDRALCLRFWHIARRFI